MPRRWRRLGGTRRLCEVCSWSSLQSHEYAEYVGADFTASAILDQFQNMSSAEAVERVLKKLASKKAQDILSVSGAQFPSCHMY